METLISVLDSIKGFMKSGEQLVKGTLHGFSFPHRHDPIQILKRLQRESFSDVMKLRDRQDKVERILSSIQSGKLSLTGTNMNGIINVGTTLFLGDDHQAYDSLVNLQKKSDVNARFTFTTRVRQTDALVAEVMARHSNNCVDNESHESPLTLSKVMYATNLSDMLSVISIPYGATCNDFEHNLNNTQDACITGFPLSRPPIFNKRHDFAAGLKLRASNIAASLAEMCAKGNQIDPTSNDKILSTFAQISYQLFAETKLSISGVLQIPCSLFSPTRFGKVKNRESRSKSHEEEASSLANSRQAPEGTSGSLCMVLDVDESTKLGGWVEKQNSNPSSLKWAVSLSDMPENDIGWGMSVGGSVEGQSNSVLMEGFLNFNVDRRGIFQPGLVFMLNGNHRAPAVVLRTSWSL